MSNDNNINSTFISSESKPNPKEYPDDSLDFENPSGSLLLSNQGTEELKKLDENTKQLKNNPETFSKFYGNVQSSSTPNEGESLLDADLKITFKPILYNFYIKNYKNLEYFYKNSQNSLNEGLSVKCPDFSTLLDHTIAVVWYLNSIEKSDDKIISISHLEWALKFLECIENENGDSYKDIEFLKSQIIDLMFEYYNSRNPIENQQENLNKSQSDIKLNSNEKTISITIDEMLKNSPNLIENLTKENSKIKLDDSNVQEPTANEKSLIELQFSKMFEEFAKKLDIEQRKQLKDIILVEQQSIAVGNNTEISMLNNEMLNQIESLLSGFEESIE